MAPTAAPPQPLVLCLHGAAQVLLADGQRLVLERRAAALLALAALEPGVPRERVARWLWPDSTDPRRNLRQQLLRFRQQFGQALVDGEALLALAPGVVLDADDRQPLLAEQAFDDCEEFAAWLQAQRQARQVRGIEALRAALAQAEQAGDLDGALGHASQWLAREPDSEAAHHELMRLHYLRGDPSAGLAVHAQLVQALAREHGRAPGAATEQLARALREARRPAARPARQVPATLQRPPRLVGRQRELAAVAAAWGSTPVVWLLGEPGLGKTRLIDELLRAERAPAGATVLQAQARPGDGGVPYATLARLLRSCLAQQAAALDAPRRLQLARVLPELAPAVPLPADGQRLLLQGAVQQLLADAGVGLVALDDLHFADEASVQMLGALIGSGSSSSDSHGGTAGRRWLLAQRPAEGAAAVRTLHDALQDDHALTPVALAPLDEAAMAELVDSLGLPELDGAALAAELVRHTGGNPLYALETLKARLLQPGPGGRMPQPASVGALIERRLRQLSAPALALARVAALAGSDFDLDLAQAVLGAGPLALADPWDELEQAQVLRGQAFAHDLVHEAALRTLPQPVAAALHAQVAAHLAQRGAEPARIAAHWLSAGRGAQALPHLVAAAERARARFEPRLAAGHWEAAARLHDEAGEPDAAFEMWFAAARAWGKLAETTELARVGDLLQPLARSDTQRARAAWVRAHLKEYAGDYAAMQAEGAAVLAHAERGGDAEMQGEGLAYLACAHYWQGRPAEALPLMERASQHYRGIGQADDAATWAHGAAVCQQSLGRLVEARQALEACHAEFERLGNKPMQANCLSILAVIAVDEARVDDAHRLLQPAQALLVDTDAAPDAWTPVATLSSRVLRLLGRPAQAMAVLAAFEQRFPSGEIAGQAARLLVERAWQWLELGRPHAVLQTLQALRAAGGYGTPVRCMEQTLRCTLQALGTPADATPDDDSGLDMQDRRGLLPLRRARAGLLPPARRAAALEPVIADAESMGLRAHALAARAERVQALVDSGQAPAAAEAALALLPQVQQAGAWAYPPAVGVALHQALATSHPDLALAQLQRVLDWIEPAAAELPPALASSFLARNPVNRQALRLAQRHPSLAAQAARLERLAQDAGAPN